MRTNLEHIIQKCRQQDRIAQQQLYKLSYQKLNSAVAVYAKTKADVDWIFNMGMLRVYDSLDNYKSGTNFLGWARTILVRTAIDHIRSNKKYNEILAPLTVEDYKEHQSEEFEKLMNKIDTQDLIQIIQGLPENEKLVFNMYELEGFSHIEIEKHTGIKKNTSKWLLSKAKSMLRTKILSSSHLNYSRHGK